MSTQRVVTLLLGALFYLSACGEAKVVLKCVKPTILETIVGLKLGGNVSVKRAQGDLEATLGKDLKADFAAADPNSWMSIAAIYQYQTCQFLNSTSCDDLPKSECLSRKQEVLNKAFDKINEQLNEINEQLNEERKRQEAEKAKQASVKVESCVAQKVAEYEVEKEGSSEGGARAAGPGWKGGRITDVQSVCYAAGAGQRIVSASTTSLSCHGGRCSVTAPAYEDGNRRVCVTTTAWSESNSGGGGGSAKYRLDVVYKNVAAPEMVNQFRAVCSTDR